MKQVVTAILGGGQGSRLWPLTDRRAKPAVPVGGKFRLIDIPISNSIHGGVRRIFVLTQFNSASLHQHIAQTYRFDSFSPGFVNILAAEQSLENRDWYQGTADAVRKNLSRLLHYNPREVCVLSGDQLYLMDMRAFVESHRSREADLTVAVKAVPREQAKSLGIMKMERDGRIVEFVEKPTDEETLDRLTPYPETLKRLGFEGAPEGSLLASMGIYVFKSEVLEEVLVGNSDYDFGKEVIPKAISRQRVFAYSYDGYWRDIGTIGSFHQANLELALPVPPLNLYSSEQPIFTHARFLPGIKVHDCEISHSVLCDGSLLNGAKIDRSVVGIRSIVRPGTVLEESVVMGANYFEAPGTEAGRIPLGIGKNCVIRRAILDRGARLGDDVQLINEAGVEEAEGEAYCIRDGIIVVRADAEIPSGTVI